MHLDLSDEETAALTQEPHNIVEHDRYLFSPRIRTLRGILSKLRPEPAREPLPPPTCMRRHELPQPEGVALAVETGALAGLCTSIRQTSLPRNPVARSALLNSMPAPRHLPCRYRLRLSPN
jgi:hypothetical protein